MTFYFSFLKKSKNEHTMSLSKTINATKCFDFILSFKKKIYMQTNALKKVKT